MILGSAKTPAEHHSVSRKAKKRVARVSTPEALVWGDVVCANVNGAMGRYAKTHDEVLLHEAHRNALALVGLLEALVEREG